MDAPGDTDIPDLPDMTPDTKGPRDESVPTSIEPAIQDDAPGTPSDGPGESLEDFGRERHDGDDTGRPSEPVDTGVSGPRGIKTAREQFTPPVESIDTSIVPEAVRDYLKPFQLADTAMALHAMTTHGGFLNAGGTGSGKSWSQVAVAKYWMDKGMKVLLVTPNEVVSPNWETGQIHGAFKSAGQKMNAMPRLNDGSKALNPGEFHVTTYHRFHDLESQVDENTVVLWDESHLLKNLTSGRSQVGDRMNQKANSVMYSTATPADKPIHIAHLSRAKVFGNRPPEATYRELGLESYADVDREGKEHINWRIDPDVGPLEVSRRLNGLFNRMTEEGLMVKRDLDMTGVRVKTRKIELPPEAHDILKKIEDEATDGMGLHSLKGLKKGVLLQHLRRQQETFKVPHIVNSIKEALAENPNRQIVVYVSRVNPSDVTYHGRTIHSSRGTPELIKKAFEGVKGVRIGELHGGSQNDPHASMRNFQDGATNVLIATMERGGIGIDLDDQVGNRPRTMIVATAPFSGDRNVQAGGRIWRETTKSKHGDTIIDYIFGDTEVDDWNQGIIATKMRTLGAVVEGEARSLDVNIPFDIGEEALEELAQSDASERIRRRDAIAKSQMHEPYRWRQLSGLEDIKREVQPGLGMEGVEDLKPGDPGYHAMMTKRTKEAGYRPSKPRQKKSPTSAQGQQSLFTQDGEPERYTAHVDQAEITADEYSLSLKEFSDDPWTEDQLGMLTHEFSVAGKKGNTPYSARMVPIHTDGSDRPIYNMAFIDPTSDRPYGVTGSGGAPDTIAHVASLLNHALKTRQPNAITFSAVEPSRQRAYRTALRHLANTHSEYVPVSIGEGPTSIHNFAIVRKDYLPSFQSAAESKTWQIPSIGQPDPHRQAINLATKPKKPTVPTSPLDIQFETPTHPRSPHVEGPSPWGGTSSTAPETGQPKRKKTLPWKPLQPSFSAFSQGGTPERYTMTDAEIAEAVKSWKEPSKAQVEAENYRKPRLHLHGLEIAIENPRGTSRKPGWKPLAHHYGYCARIAGAPAPDARDGDQEAIDCFIGPDVASEVVFIVDQEFPSGRFDEHKVLFGFTNYKDARQGYLDNYPSDWHCGPITALTMNQFRAWLESGDTTRRVAEQVSKYTASHDFDLIHPRDKKTKRFIRKHKSLTLAQTLDRPPTTPERNAYREYVKFLRVGKNKPMPFKKWLDFHRAEKFRTQEQEIQRDSAEQEGSEASQVQDQAASRGQDQTEAQPTRPSRSTGEPSRNSLIHNFATALYNSYYRPSK
jgi:hypothetical protein